MSPRARPSRKTTWPGIIDTYRSYLPVSSKTPVITLREGNTPLLLSQGLSRRVGHGAEVYLKYEGANPTGSFKDRGMTLAISKAVEAKSVAVACASTGNTSASASAYAARAGLRSIVLIPSGAIALGKLSQALIHGARIASVEANFDACLALVKSLTQKYPVTLVNSLNPYRIEGQKTVAFEICDCLGRAPDINITPVGNAGNITAQWKGYQEYYRWNVIGYRPVMLGFQAEGAAPIVKGRIIAHPRTIASAIRIGNPASWQAALTATEESHGFIQAVSDREILDAHRLLAVEDGLFVEPASAASVAGLLKLVRVGYFTPPVRAGFKSRQAAGGAATMQWPPSRWPRNAGREGVRPKVAAERRPRRAGGRGVTIVCILTGHGLKDPELAIKQTKAPKTLPPSLSAITKAVGLK